MPIITDFPLPNSQTTWEFPSKSETAFFIAFLASIDPATGKAWCPDVVAALPPLTAVFSADGAPEVAFVEVGQRPAWKVLSNVYRTKWNISNVPTLVRYERVNGEVKEVGRLVEGEILDEKRLKNLIDRSPAQL